MEQPVGQEVQVGVVLVNHLLVMQLMQQMVQEEEVVVTLDNPLQVLQVMEVMEL